MQYGGPAFQALRGEKSSELDRSAQRRCLQPAGAFTQSQHRDFHVHLPFLAAFDLPRLVLQPPFADRHAGRGIA